MEKRIGIRVCADSFIIYSVLSASTGSLFAAIRLGMNPPTIVKNKLTRIRIIACKGECFATFSRFE